MVYSAQMKLAFPEKPSQMPRFLRLYWRKNFHCNKLMAGTNIPSQVHGGHAASCNRSQEGIWAKPEAPCYPHHQFACLKARQRPTFGQCV